MIKVSFQGMEHSDALENCARDKVVKLDEFLQREDLPHHIEFHLKAFPNHAHQEITLHVKTQNLNLLAHTQDPDMYKALDDVVDKMVAQIKKEREKMRDAGHKVETEKSKFYK